jgi:hypothetical protein
MIFFLLKTIDLIDVFFTVNQLSVSIQSMFFSPSVPTYDCYKHKASPKKKKIRVQILILKYNNSRGPVN